MIDTLTRHHIARATRILRTCRVRFTDRNLGPTVADYKDAGEYCHELDRWFSYLQHVATPPAYRGSLANEILFLVETAAKSSKHFRAVELALRPRDARIR